jgi:peroxiredoxin
MHQVEVMPMVALLEGTKAPAVSLVSLDGTVYSLAQTLAKSPLVLLAFFKVGCPVCQFTFPYLERLYKIHPNAQIWGISQDDAQETKAYAQAHGCTFPMLLDSTLAATVEYGLTNVPTTFLVKNDFTIAETVHGFDKAGLEQLNKTLATVYGSAGTALFTAADDVPDFRPG